MKKHIWVLAVSIALVLICLTAVMGVSVFASSDSGSDATTATAASDTSPETTPADDSPVETTAPIETNEVSSPENNSSQKQNKESDNKKDLSFFARVKELFSNDEYMDTIWEGLKTTLIISVFAALLGLFVGTLIAFVLIAKDTPWLFVPKWICRAFVTVIRGTPMALQLFIMAYVIFAIRGFPEVITAIIAFGLNSSAYISENIRAGILSVDVGQTEAGRALGLPSRITMLKIVIPQAIKNVIPAIGNELIALIKETSIVSMIGMFDLTMAAKIIGGGNNMASYIVPMAVVALFYLAIVYLLTFVIKMIERRLRASDRN